MSTRPPGNLMLARLLTDPAALDALPREHVPDALAEIERVRAALWAKLITSESPPARNGGEVDYLTAKQVAGMLQVDVSFAYRHQHQLGAVRLSDRAVRFPRAAVGRFLERRRT